MPALSTVQPARTWLLSTFQNHPQLGAGGVSVINGPAAYTEGAPAPGTLSGDKAVWVGWSSNPLVESGVEFTSPPPSLGGQRDLEVYTIHCNAAAISHDASVGNMAAAQNAANSIYAAAREIITLNRNLGGLQGMASIVKGAETSTQTGGKANTPGTGVRVDIEFDIQVKAFQTYQP